MAPGVYGIAEYGCHISSYISLHISDAKSRISVSKFSECSFTSHQLYAFSSSTVLRKLRTFIFVNIHLEYGMYSIRVHCCLIAKGAQRRVPCVRFQFDS